VTSTKQPVNALTGLVVLASNDSTDRYWHADIALPGTPTVPVPVSSFTATPQTGTAPLAVQFTDTSTNNPTGWSWDFGDGRTSTVQNPNVTYQQPGTYTVTMAARNASGTGAPATRTITVSPPAPSGGITRMSTASAVSTTASQTLTIPTPSGTQAGDVLVSCLALNGSSIAAAPSGWIRAAAPTGVSNPRVYGYYKIAETSEPPSTVWTFSASITSGGGIARYSGAQGVDGSASTATGPSATTATVPGVTATVAGSMLVGCMGINSGSTSVGIGPSDLTEAWDIGGKRHEYGDGQLTTAGATGPRTWAFTSGREWAGWLMALRPR
jgi:PKD repeat protein